MVLNLILDDNNNIHNNKLETSPSIVTQNLRSINLTYLMGQHIVLRNIAIVNIVNKIESIEIPAHLTSLESLIHECFPLIDIKVRKTKNNQVRKSSRQNLNLRKGRQSLELLITLRDHSRTLRILPNLMLSISIDGNLIMEKVSLSWNFLKFVRDINKRDYFN